MKRYACLALVLLSFVACGGSTDDGSTDSQAAATASAPANNDPAPTAVTDTEPTSVDAPTATAAPVESSPTTASVSISFLMVSGAAPGGRASVTIRTDPVGVECDISYTTPNGTLSEAEGLEPAVTRGSGTVSWEWTISAATEPGTGSVAVTCDGVRATSDIEIAVE